MIPPALPGTEGLDNLPLYRRLAEGMERLIHQGTFRAGDRVPSVRQLAREWSVSISTVTEAYRILENRGLIEARPQSGYYVQARLNRVLAEPLPTAPECRPQRASADELAGAIFHDIADPNLLHFGPALPHPDLLPWEKLNRTLATVARRMKGGSTNYEDTLGAKRLRGEIARRAIAAGCALAPDQLLVTNGCTEAVALALRAVARPGDTIAVESPFYYGFAQILESIGCRALELPTHSREGLSVDALRYAMEYHRVRAVLASPNFSNPLGSCMSDDRKLELAELLAKADVPLIEDDIYGDLSFQEDRPKAVKAYDRTGHVIWCSSISKTLAPGWRVGWIAGGRYHGEIVRLKRRNTLAQSTPIQAAVAEFLANGGYDHHLRRLRRTLAARGSELRDAVARHFPAGTRMSQPGGGYVVWVELPGGVDTVELYYRARGAGITFAPGVLFSSDGGRYRHCLRLNSAHAGHRIEEGIGRLGRLITASAKSE